MAIVYEVLWNSHGAQAGIAVRVDDVAEVVTHIGWRNRTEHEWHFDYVWNGVDRNFRLAPSTDFTYIPVPGTAAVREWRHVEIDGEMQRVCGLESFSVSGV